MRRGCAASAGLPVLGGFPPHTPSQVPHPSISGCFTEKSPAHLARTPVWSSRIALESRIRRSLPQEPSNPPFLLATPRKLHVYHFAKQACCLLGSMGPIPNSDLIFVRSANSIVALFDRFPQFNNGILGRMVLKLVCCRDGVSVAVNCGKGERKPRLAVCCFGSVGNGETGSYQADSSCCCP